MAGIFQNGAWSDGWDHYNTVLQKWDGVAGTTAINTGNARFAGGQGFSINSFASGSNGYMYKNLVTQLTTVICGFAFKTQVIPNGVVPLFTMYDSVANAGQINLAIDQQGRLQFYLGGGLNGGGTALGPNSGAVFLHGSSWYYLEIKYTVSATVGLVELRLNGNTSAIISFSGNTQSTANTWVDRIILNCPTTSTTNYFDDLYLLDNTGAAPLNNYLGDTRIVTVFPNADSATAGLNQFSTQPAQAAGSHYLNVDENPPDMDTSYNFDAVVNDRESYRHTTATVNGAISFVNAWAMVEKDDASTRQVAITTRSGVTDVIGPTINTPSSYSYFNQVTAVDPATSAAWTQAGVNGAEFGLKIIT